MILTKWLNDWVWGEGTKSAILSAYFWKLFARSFFYVYLCTVENETEIYGLTGAKNFPSARGRFS